MQSVWKWRRRDATSITGVMFALSINCQTGRRVQQPRGLPHTGRVNSQALRASVSVAAATAAAVLVVAAGTWRRKEG